LVQRLSSFTSTSQLFGSTSQLLYLNVSAFWFNISDRDMFPSSGGTLPVSAQEIDDAKAAWKAQLRDTLNNYIWIGARFTF
jgi:hypothetical protein